MLIHLVLSENNKDTTMRFITASKQSNLFIKTICCCLIFVFSAKADDVPVENDNVVELYNVLYTSLKEFRANHEYQKGIAASSDYLAQMEKAENGKKKRYALLLESLSDLYDDSGKYDNAIETMKEASEILKKETSDTSKFYLASINNLAKIYNHAAQFDKAIVEFETVRAILKKTGKVHSDDYAAVTGSLALVYENTDNYGKAIELHTEALDIYELNQGKQSTDYAIKLGMLAGTYYHNGEFLKAIQLTKEALSILELEIGQDNNAYMVMLNNLSQMQASVGEYVESLLNMGRAKDICESLYGANSPTFAQYLCNYGNSQFNFGKIAEAIAHIRQALDIQKNVYDKDTKDIGLTMSLLGSCYSEIGNFTEALRLRNEAKEIFAKTIGKESILYAQNLRNISTTYYYLGNLYESNRNINEAVDIVSKILGKDNVGYANMLINKAVVETDMKNYQKSIETYDSILYVLENSVGTHNDNYARVLLNKSQSMFYYGQVSEAFEAVEKSQIILADIYGKIHPNYAKALYTLGSYHAANEDYKKAIDCTQESLTLFENVYGHKHPLYIFNFSDLCGMLSLNGNHSSAAANAIKCNDLRTSMIMRTFMDLTSHERSLLWQKHYKWYTNVMPRIALFSMNKRILQTAYNAVLFSKSLLLNTEIELLNLISEEGNDDDINLYHAISDARRQLTKIYELPIENQKLKTDSIEKFIKDSEIELLNRSKAYGDYTKRLCVKWEDVQNALGPNDIAIEFASFHNISEFQKNDSLQYIAFVLKKDYEAPKVLPICKIPYEKALFGSDISRTINEGDIIWGPLADVLDDVENIYFSPTGELYNVPIEYMNYFKDESKSMSDVFNIKRLSSTREIALRNNNGAAMSTASLFGGLIYGNSDVADNAQKRGCEENDMSILRDHFGPLVETKSEVENISKYLKQMDVKYKLYTDSIGTESSFRALSKSNLNLLHIATHGFYWTQKDVRRFNFTGFLNPNRFANFSEEDRALARSGILFAGAETSFQSVSDNFDPDDGIVTAKEIAQLDFRNMDLAVLSACQTGLGDISPDGVYGLQRGFKKAGVQSLLMSLWKVDDKATQLLMTNFYKGLAEGKSKVEALRSAQDYLRNLEVEEVISSDDNLTAAQRRKAERQDTSQEESVVKSRPYASPKYWSAFVLLDALD